MSDSQCGCVCGPNKSNGEVIAAQVLSIVAWGVNVWHCYYTDLFQFVITWVTMVLVIYYQVLWCVSVPKNLHWAFIVPTFFISGCNFYTAIVFLFFVPEGFIDSLFYWVPAVLWLVAAILELVFVLKKSEVKVDTEDANNVDAGEDV